MSWQDRKGVISSMVLMSIICASGCTSNRSKLMTKPGAASSMPSEFRNSLGIRFIYIPAGTFVMGYSKQGSASPAFAKLEEQHTVTIEKPFYISATEITNRQFQKFVIETSYSAELRANPKFQRLLKNNNMPQFTYPNYPAIIVSWNEAVAFCQWLSKRERRTYRLPTEEEWEYVCRSGTQKRYGCASTKEDLLKYAWFSANSEEHPHAVASKLPNAYGVFDMNGNVWEWTGSIVPADIVQDSLHKGQKCAFIRGGGYFNSAEGLRCAARWGFFPVTYRSSSVGFRVVLTMSPNE